jgi:hypothetical protein
VGDIKRVDVDHGVRRLRVVIQQPLNDAVPDQYEVYVDTTPRRPGADFVLFDYHGVWGNKDVIYRVDRWRDQDWGARVRCPEAEMDRRNRDHRPMIEFTVPRRCLGSPQVLRIQAIAAQEHMVNDYAPGKRRPTRCLRGPAQVEQARDRGTRSRLRVETHQGTGHSQAAKLSL